MGEEDTRWKLNKCYQRLLNTSKEMSWGKFGIISIHKENEIKLTCVIILL